MTYRNFSNRDLHAKEANPRRGHRQRRPMLAVDAILTAWEPTVRKVTVTRIRTILSRIKDARS